MFGNQQSILNTEVLILGVSFNSFTGIDHFAAQRATKESPYLILQKHNINLYRSYRSRSLLVKGLRRGVPQ